MFMELKRQNGQLELYKVEYVSCSNYLTELITTN